MNGQNTKKKGSPWLGILLALMFFQPALFFPVAVFGGIVWLISSVVKKQSSASTTTTQTYRSQQTSGTSASRTVTQTTTRYTTRQERFDNCDQGLFCRHDDKAVHHVRRGKEIDPWDRPDIDISKYQRKG